MADDETGTVGRTHAATISSITDAEYPAFTRFAEVPFANELSDETIAAWRGLIEPQRFFAAKIDGTIVGSAGATGRQLTVPGGRTAPCAAITAVAVRIDHRRQGLLRRLMAQLLADAQRRGEPFAALMASEPAIYGRFGFGLAIPTVNLTVERAWAQLRRPPVGMGRAEVVDMASAEPLIAPIREAVRQQRHGMLSRPDAEWHLVTAFDPPAERAGAGARQVAVIADRGYVIWRIKADWNATGPDGTVIVESLVALDPDALAVLWDMMLSMDLCAKVEAKSRPVDDPLPAMVTDDVRVARHSGVPFFLRLVDVQTGLSARRYTADGSIEIAVTDKALPDQAGVYRIDVADGVADVSRRNSSVTSGRVARLGMDIEDLSACYLGTTRITQLAAAGRVSGTPESLLTFDRMFATSIAAWHDTEF